MSVNQSFLSNPKYGYDFVVATTQASIDSGLKEYLSEVDQPSTILCFLADGKGQPATQISLKDLKKKTNGIDPFDIPNGTDYSDERITTLTQNMFVAGLKIKLGLPPGVLPKDLPSIVELGSSASTVNFNMLCSEFVIIQNSPPSGFGNTGSWNVSSQPVGKAWLINVIVDLVYADLDKELNTPYFNKHPKQRAAILDQLKNLNSGAFSLQQLLFDLENATLQSLPKIDALDPVLAKAFLNIYAASAKEHGSPILSVHAVANAPDGSSLRLTGIERYVDQFVDGNGIVVPDPTPEQIQVTTLNYLCAANNNPLPGAASFNWNWVEPADVGNESGVVAINRNTLARYFANALMSHIKPHCLEAETNMKVWPGGSVQCGGYVTPGNTPQTITISPSGSEILTISYGSNADSNDKAGATYGELDLHSSFTCTVSFSGNTITIVQHLTLWLKFQWDLTETDGNLVDKMLTDVYTISVGQNGDLQLTLTSSTPTDNSQDLDFNGFTNFWLNDINQIIEQVKNDVSEFGNIDLSDFPAVNTQNFVFPGANVFTFTDVKFSDNQDLVTGITYLTPNAQEYLKAMI